MTVRGLADRARLHLWDRWPDRGQLEPRTASPGAVLVMDEAEPDPDRSAGGVFIQQLMELIREVGREAIFLPALGGAEVPEAWLRAHRGEVGAVILARPEIGRRFARRVRQVTPAPVFAYTHDLHFLREQRRYEQTHDPRARRESRRLRGVESRLFRRVDGVITPSPAEVAEIRRLAPGIPVHVVPPFVRDDLPAQEGLANRRVSLFVGGFRHQPNVDAALILGRTVMPLVWAEVPDAEVRLVGPDPPPAVRALANRRMTVAGHVPDLAAEYALARLTVSPLRYGAGVKGKILGALEAGVPVVTTSIGNEGIDLEPGTEALIEDDPVRLAEAVVRLYREPELLASLAAKGSHAARSRFSRARALAAVEALLSVRTGGTAPGSSAP